MYNKKTIFWAACLGMLFFGIVFITLGTIAPDLREKLDYNELQIGTLFSILPFGILIGSLLFGPIADRFGYRILLFVSCFLMFAGFEGIAYSSSTALLRICILLIGIGGGIVNGATNALVSDISDRDKAANLSLLGVFYAIGALGMPLILGLLRSRLSYESTVSMIGMLTLATAIMYLFIKFPEPKQQARTNLWENLTNIKSRLLFLLAFFLFFQSSFEGIINNWTTSYLIEHHSFEQGRSLIGLSLMVAGMASMRLLIGSVFRNSSTVILMSLSFALIFIGLMLVRTGISFGVAMGGLVLLGAGLAAGFPVMLGIAGSVFSKMSGTAFSFILTVALIGNMLINYLMGFIAQHSGVKHLITVALLELLMMIMLFLLIFRETKINNKQI